MLNFTFDRDSFVQGAWRSFVPLSPLAGMYEHSFDSKGKTLSSVNKRQRSHDMNANDQLPLHFATIPYDSFAYSYNVYGTNSNRQPLSFGAGRGTRCEQRHHRKICA